MNKVLLCSHESDADGIGAVVLAKIAFDNLDYKLFQDPNDLEIKFRKMIVNGELDDYDRIYITDLSLLEPSISMVNDSNLRDKLLVFDHHQRGIELGLRKYPFTTIIEEDESGKRCGTELFYRYLVKNGLIPDKKSIETFVEYTREEDTWDWKDNGEEGKKAHMLSTLFNIYGREKYADLMYNKLINNDEFYYTDDEMLVISDKISEYNRVLNKLTDEMECFIDSFGNKYGVLFSEYQYRNEIPEFIMDKGNPWDVKYVIIVAMDKGEFGQKSYRRIDDTIDCNKIAMLHGGGGHVGSAAVSITKEQNKKVKSLDKKEALEYIVNSSYSLE